MTDITIINGVNVSGCEYLRNDECRCEVQCSHIENGEFIIEFEMFERNFETDNFKCLQNPNCYFKQSVRKDDRIRELEEENKDIKTACEKYRKAELETPWVKIASFYKVENAKYQQKLSQIAELANKADCIIYQSVYHCMTTKKAAVSDLNNGHYGELDRMENLNSNVFKLNKFLKQIIQIAKGE